MLMWIHPVVQTLAVCLSLYVLLLGWVRFSTAHLGRKNAVFAWNTHVRYGTAVLMTWILAFALGIGAAWWSWEKIFVTDSHYQVALAMLPLLFFGLGSGLLMDRNKARRRVLPLVHAAANTLLVLLALVQVYTGVIVLKDFILG